MVVNNGMSHDARVLKCAQALAGAQADVQVLGVGRTRESGELGPARLERLVVLPERGLRWGYARWALARRLGRLGRAANWRRSLAITHYYERAFLPALRELQPDAIHVHDVHLLPTVVRYAGEAMPRPYVIYDAHEYVAGLAVSGSRTQRVVDAWASVERDFIHSVDRVITVSAGLAAKIRHLHQLDQDPAVVHNAPILGNVVPAVSLRDECGINKTTRLAVYSGAVSAARGLETVIAALPYHPDLHLAIVAVPRPHPMVPEFKAQARRLGVADRLHFPPPVPSHEVSGYIAAADFAVSPILGSSVSYDMALPNKLFEYLHAGLPMVVSDCQAISRFVAHHKLGVVFRAGSEVDLSRAIGEITNYPWNQDTRKLKREYSWQGQVPHLLSVYRERFSQLLPVTPEETEFHIAPSWHSVH